MTSTRLLASAAALVMALGLAACSAEAEEPTVVETPDATSSPEPTETAEPEPVAEVFAMPADCTAVLPQARVDALAAQGITLVGGPGAEFEEYLPEPTREEAAGGISCFFEDAARPNVSALTVSVAPVATATRAQIVTDLTAQGLNEGQTADGDATFWVLGDEQGPGAVHNVITDDAWVSVVNLYGGQVFYDETVLIASEVLDTVYD